jgi:hypothetical protein
MQSVPVTTDVVSSSRVRDEVYNIREGQFNFQRGDMVLEEEKKIILFRDFVK